MKRISTGAACLLATLAAGCTTPPADYAATLSTQDPKWETLECDQARLAASGYKDTSMNVTTGILLGPYGLGIMAASKEAQAKKRKALARETHMQCSSLPLPRELAAEPSPA